METREYYKVKVELLATGRDCVIWAEKGSGVSQARARELADEYDSAIRPKIVGAFGKKNFYANTSNGREVDANFQGSTRFFNDILNYANWRAGRDDGKLTILLLDIKDGYKEGGTSYIAGYFDGINFFEGGNANRRDMIYIDTYPGMRGNNIKQPCTTLAHELQHLVNFVTNYLLLSGKSMDTWIDEGLSAWAEYLYQEENPVDKCEWFIDDKAGTIAKGNNFFVWGNHTEDKPEAILDDYATVYLFFRWLYLQAAAHNPPIEDIFRQIITSPKVNHDAVTDVAKEINPDWNSWEKLLGAWLAANYNPGNTNYGYKNDEYLIENMKVKPITDTLISLYPGEGVYSRINSSFTPAEGGTNIRYAGLSSAITSTVSISGSFQSYTGNTLLTFNTGTAYDDRNPAESVEQGRLTGLSSIVPAMMSTEKEKAVEFKGPYVIDARDVLGRNRENGFLLSPGQSGH